MPGRLGAPPGVLLAAENKRVIEREAVSGMRRPSRENAENVEPPSDKGMEMMTPFPVPTHRRLQDTTKAVILTKEKPSLPVPGMHTAHT